MEIQFLIFAGVDYEANGGARDIIGEAITTEEATKICNNYLKSIYDKSEWVKGLYYENFDAFLKDHFNNNWMHIYSINQKKIIDYYKFIS